MSQKQKVLAAAIAVAVVAGFGFLYSQFSAQAPSKDDASFGKTTRMMQDEQRAQEAAAIPATPDAAVDAIIDDAVLDDSTLENEVSGEKDAITASGEEINNLGQTYDADQL